MLPRPHIIQSDKTFVIGPRMIEGIQEVFLVVMRPKLMQDICVEANLETAHIINTPKQEIEKRTHVMVFSVFPAIGEVKTDSETYHAPEGWEIGGYQRINTPRPSESPIEITVTPEYFFVSGHAEIFGVVGEVKESDFDDPYNDHIHAIFQILLRKKAPTVTYDKSFWVTGRSLCCCPPDVKATPISKERGEIRRPMDVLDRDSLQDHYEEQPSLLYETSLTLDNVAIDKSCRIGKNDNIPTKEANQIVFQLGNLIKQSVNHPNRYRPGTMDFANSQFFSHAIANIIKSDGHSDDDEVNIIRGLNPHILAKIATCNSRFTRSDLLQMSPLEQQDRFNLSESEVRKLRRSLVGLEGPIVPPNERWNTSNKRQTRRVIPDVVNLPLRKARIKLAQAGLSVRKVVYQDSEQPKDTVVKQDPVPGNNTASDSVELVLASGKIVELPNLLGLPLNRSLLILGQSGLQSEPEIVFSEQDAEKKANVVFDMKPKMGTFVTPNSQVVLYVGRKSRKQVDENAKQRNREKKVATK